MVVFEPVEKVQCENVTRMILTSTILITWISLLFRVASEIPLLLEISWENPGAQRNRRLYNFAEAVLLGVVQVCCEARFGKGIVQKKRQHYDSNWGDDEMMFVCFFHMLQKRHEKSPGIIVRCFSLELFVAILVGRWWREHAETQRQLFESLVFASTSVDLGIAEGVWRPWCSATWWSTAISFRGWTFIWLG